MPNWCEGTLRVRGKGKDIQDFFGENLMEIDTVEDNEGIRNVITPIKNLWIDRGSYITFNFESGDLWFSETNRMFTCGCKHISFEKDDMEIIVSHAIQIQQAWSIQSDYLQRMSEKYNLEIKILAFEHGNEFAQDIYIKNGELIKDEDIEYDDWTFDCPCPLLGG
jgi:hypothetical protein